MFSVIIGFLVLITLIVMRVSIVIVAPIASSIIAILNHLNILEVFNNYYLPGFAEFVQNYFFIFLLSSLLGKIMESSGDAVKVGEYVIDIMGPRYVAVGIFFTSAVMVYGGISGFVIIFTIYPIARSVFEEAGLSKSLILAAIAGGNIIMGIPLPGSPQIHNLIMMDFFGTSAVAGLKVGLIGILFSMTFSVGYLYYRTKKLTGENFSDQGSNFSKIMDGIQMGEFLFCLSPMLTIFLFLAVLKIPPVISLFLGVVVALIKNIKKININMVINESISNASVPLLYASSAMGFGGVISHLPVFREFMNNIINMSSNPYILIGVLTNIAAGLMGSASGGLLLTISTVGEKLVHFAEPEKLHRIMIIAATGLDTLPHNSSYLAMLSFTGLKLKETYFDYFIISVIAPFIALTVAIIAAVFL